MTYKATILVTLALAGVLVFAGCTDTPAEDTGEGADFPEDEPGDDQNQTANTGYTDEGSTKEQKTWS